MEKWFNHIWYERTRPPLWLIPFSWLFAALSALRRWFYRKGIFNVITLPVPVIVVGNITVGGTGKTPMTLAVVQLLQQQGHKPGIVLRGYKGQGGNNISVTADSDPAIVGDEAVLLAQRSACPVIVGKDRPAAAQQLLAEHTVDCIVSDDGLQHYRLARDLEIAVVDGARSFGNGWLLPVGPLREPAKRLQQTDVIVINGKSNQSYVGNALNMQLQADTAIDLISGARRHLSDFQGQSVHGVAGIGNPQRFFQTLRQQGINVLEHPLPDHASIGVSDLAFDDTLPVMMTEKDAVKCCNRALPENRYWYLPVSADFNAADKAHLDTALANIFDYINTP
ncbi:MAG TPA: tetraacyldisaccharide 4'-kinase [Gammaproteobacteria bacterium]|nr:tetraacyldisaccharide 4'-kinase [Gammaproteobacteria bacterium]